MSKCAEGLTEKEYLNSYCKSLSKGQLEYHWSKTFFACVENGMNEKWDATDLYNVLKFIKQFNPATPPRR